MQSVKRRPLWVPEWAWEQYASFYGAPDGVLAKIISDNSCEKVWRVIERHDAPEDAGLTVCLLFEQVQSALLPPRADEGVRSKERETRGKEIARLARELRGELISLTENGYPPAEFVRAYRRSWSRVRESLPAYRSSDRAPEDNEVARITLQEMRDGVQLGFMGALVGDCAALEAIEMGGVAWSKTRPFAYRPEQAGFERTYFVRQISGFFSSLYGRPYHAATAALTFCVFDEEISDNAVGQLVRRGRKSASKRKKKKK